MEVETTTTMDYFTNGSTQSSGGGLASGEFLLSTTEKPFAESFNETFQKVITTKDMVRLSRTLARNMTN
jgi:hypothetical protein